MHRSLRTNITPTMSIPRHAAGRESSLVCGTMVMHQNLESRCQLRPHTTAPAARSHIPISLYLQMAPLSFSLDPGLITLNKHHSQSISLKKTPLVAPVVLCPESSRRSSLPSCCHAGGKYLLLYIRYPLTLRHVDRRTFPCSLVAVDKVLPSRGNEGLSL